ncbi:type IV secretion system protein [Paracoccus sulfuroxidans]|uniref:Type IV secretory pathway VirB6-like protein n=1 Tax=Paracoccus sulfuroxidans TaxID=384678 RepID=A0A562N7X1_9RHOB|nr:type IV secretion system protein [Paracoccus sulfuroxidans]TWI28203.1 type IV secretory pathway VirB6-like protein [Paracoccus sulfuroxidans]
MATVTDLLTSLDRSISSAGERYFETTAEALGPIMTIMMTIFIVALGINIALGAASLSLRDTKQLMWRVILVYTFSLSWANFGVLYHALSEGSGNLAMGLFDAEGGEHSNPNAAMDSFAKNMADTVDTVSASRGSIQRGVIGGIAYVFLSALMAAYILVVGFAKIMIAFLLGVAPLAMIATIFDKTRNLFEAWLESFVGYLMYPIAASAIITSIVAVGEEQAVAATSGDATLGSILGFFVVVFVGIFALKSIPSAAGHLSGQFRLASITPAPVTSVARGLIGERATMFRSGMLTGGVKRKDAADARERVWAERGGKLAQKIRLSKVLGTEPKP